MVGGRFAIDDQLWPGCSPAPFPLHRCDRRHIWRWRRDSALLAALPAPGARLSTEFVPQVRPGSTPAAIAFQTAQRQEGIDVLALPVHAGSFEPRFDQHLVGALDTTTADRIARRPKPGIANLLATLRQIAATGSGLLPCLARQLRILTKRGQPGQDELLLAV